MESSKILFVQENVILFKLNIKILCNLAFENNPFAATCNQILLPSENPLEFCLLKNVWLVVIIVINIILF